MGAKTWELERDIFLAMFQGKPHAAAALRLNLTAYQAQCSHTEHPEKKGQCLWCSVSMVRTPGLVKTRIASAERKVG